jgi:PAS domain S-box-containing protein
VFRKRLSYGMCVRLLLGTFLAIGIAGLIAFGLVGGGVLILAMFAVVTTVILGTRAGLIACAIGMGILVAVGVAICTDLIDFPAEIGEDEAAAIGAYAQSPAAWAILVVGYVLFVSVTVVCLGVVHSNLVATLHDARESQAKYRGLIESSSDWIWELDREDVYTYVSPKVRDILGYAPEEVIGKTPFDLMPPDEATRVTEIYEEITRNGAAIVALENVNLHKDGRHVVLETSGVPVLDETGVITGYRGIDRDITERKAAEQAQRESEGRFRGYFELGLVGMATTSLEKGWLQFNDKLCQILGYPREELTEKTWAELTHPDDLAADEAEFERVLAGEIDGYSMDKRFIRKDGRTIAASISVRCLRRGDGRPDHFVALIQDITERKHRENTTAAQLRLSEFGAYHTVTELLQSFLDEVEALTGSEIGFYHFVEADQVTLKLEAWSTNTLEKMCKAEGAGSHYPIDQAGVWVDCIREGRPVIHNDYASLPHRKGMPEGHAPVIRELLVPVYRADKIVAVVGVGNKRTDYDAEDVQVVQELANMACDLVGRMQAEEALQESEALLNESQAIARIGSWKRDLVDGRLVWSDQTYRILGLSPEHYVAASETFTSVVHPDDREAIDTAYNDSIRDKLERYEIEHRIVRRDTGMTRYVRQECRHVRDTAGKLVRTIGMIQDITEHKRISRAMEVLAGELAGLTGDELFAALVGRLTELLDVEYAAVGEWRAEDPDTVLTAAFCHHGEIVENIKYNLPGSPCETVIGKEACSYPDHVAEDFPADQMLADVGARGYVGIPLFDDKHKPMGLLWIVDTKPITDPEFAKSVLGSFAVRAAAELARRRSEQTLSESEHRYRTLFEVAGDAIFLMEGQRFIDCNPRTLDMFGCTREELLNAYPYEFSPPTQPDGSDSKEKAVEKIKAAFTGESQFFEWEHCRLDRSTFAAEVSLDRLDLDGRPHLLAIVRDISERKRIEEELTRGSELKSKFIQVAGHELRTPLSYIMAMPKLVESIDDVAKLKGAIRNMEAKARRLSDIVQSMFKLMDAEEFAEHLDLEEIGLSDILDRVYADCEPFVEERYQTLTMQIDDDIPALQADFDKIHDVIENLIGNAIKFTPKGGTIRVRAAREGADHVSIAVADQGPGISTGDLPNIFTPFYCTEDVMKHSSGSIGKMKHGMGLGLAVVKHFTEMHGGTITVSTSENGSTFTVRLPLEPSEQTLD